MIRFFIVILLSCCCSLLVCAQYSTRSMDAQIRTLRVRYVSDAIASSGSPQRPYLLLLDGLVDGVDASNSLEISFDELSHDVHQYSYRVEHCDKEWHKSEISSYEYLDGFTSADIVDYIHSTTTQQAYTHYWLSFPNSEMRLKASGNYVLSIYEDGDYDKVVATVCFSVVDPKVDIGASVRANTDIELNGRYQQLDIDVHMADLELRDVQDLTVVVEQNGRMDNRVMLYKPSFVEPKRLRYMNQRSLIFEGGNEFRRFDAYSTYYAGYNVDVVDYVGGEYHVWLNTDEVRGTMSVGAGREGMPYMTELDANGQWVINCEKSDYPDTEAEYMWVHFYLPVPNPLQDVRVFIGGDMFYHQFSYQNMMDYDADRKCYHARAYLKQGGYNYLYYTVQTSDSIQTCGSEVRASLLPIEGSHWDTKNEYMIRVYYRPFGARYDQLVGLKKI